MSPMKIFIICLAFAAIVPTEALLLKKKIALLKTVPKLKKQKAVHLVSSVPKLKKQALGYVLPSLAGSAIAAVPKLKKQKLALAGSAVAAIKPVVSGPAIISPGISVSGGSSTQVQYLPSYQPTIVATGLPSAVTYQHVNYPSIHTQKEISASLPFYQKIVKF